MNNRISKSGRSSKWLNYYLSHDVQADTSKRLGFVKYFNMPLEESGDGPADSERAAKIMAFVAMHWEDLQRAHHEAVRVASDDPAVIDKPYRKPPRPPEKPAYSFALRFDPNDLEKITPELLVEAGVGAIAALGMGELYHLGYEHKDYNHALTPEAIAATHETQEFYVPPAMLAQAAAQNAGKLDLDALVSDLPVHELRRVMIAAMKRQATNFDTPEKTSLLAANEYSKKPLEHLDINIIPGDGVEVTADYSQHPPHFHMSVCKIHPVTGRTHKTFEDALALSKFCEEFAAKHGLKKVNQRVANNARRAKGEYVAHDQVPRADYELFKSYRGKTQAAVTRQRRDQQESDRADLTVRHGIKRQVFNRHIATNFSPVQREVLDAIEASNRTVTLDHMGMVFKVFTRLKQRVTGELQREQKRLSALRKTLGDLEKRIATETSSFEDGLARDVAKMAAVHAVQLTRDAKYFENLRRRRKTETAGESGRKAHRAAAQNRKRKEPDTHLKADLLKQQRDARIDDSEDPAIRLGKSMGHTPTPPARDDDAPKTPGEAVDKIMKSVTPRSERTKKADRQPGRPRKPRTRKRDR